MTYQEALKYLESFINYEKQDGYNYKSSLKLERMKRFAALLGDPQEYTKAVHIAGTKGKGSTASYTHSILTAAGFKTGLYTSPHLVDFRERIRIGRELISKEDLSSITEKIKSVVESHMKNDRPSFFEVYTAIAFIYFKQMKCDFAVYEVGLGGRLDATNLVGPLVCAITPLSYEHTDKLGPTLEDIANEKCGIIKSGSICVSAPQPKEALKVIEDVCNERNARLILVGKDIKFEEIRSSDTGEVFDVKGTSGEYKTLESRLLGSHQVVNAATAIGIVEALASKGIDVSENAIRIGIEEARWDGRLEVVGTGPLIIIDGAQNRASASCLSKGIKKLFKYRKLILVLGVSKDKDINGILEELLPISDSVVLTRSRLLARAMEPEIIKEAALKTGKKIEDMSIALDSREALKKAVSKAGKEDLILVTGSLFLVGEVKECLAKESVSGCIKTH